MESKITNIFTGKKASSAFTSVSTIKKSKEGKKFTKSTIENVLSNIVANNVHKPIRKKFQRRFVSVPTINHQFGADLIEIKHPRSNFNKKYILAVLDLFSRSAWLEPLKNKTADEVLNAIKKIFQRTKRTCLFFQSDDGREFVNSKLRSYFKSMGIESFVTASSTKCCINERFNRTLGQRVARYLTHVKSKRFVHKLKDFERQYNACYHSTIKCAPNDVNENNVPEIWENIYGPKIKKLNKQSPETFKKGDLVLIPRKKTLFEKGYAQNYGTSIYKIHLIKNTKPVTYELASLDNQVIVGSWYKQELVRISSKFEHASV